MLFTNGLRRPDVESQHWFNLNIYFARSTMPMGRSQETFNKKQREKKRAQKKKAKQEKKESRKSEGGGIEIDWDSAPINETLTPEEAERKANNNKTYNNENRNS